MSFSVSGLRSAKSLDLKLLEYTLKPYFPEEELLGLTESAEEEFAYVIEGHPQVWIDGDVFDLRPGDFVAFPPGTGIAHTFLNNSEKISLLLVGGEANKPENKIFYLLHPARNNQCKEKGTFWEDHPIRSLGPHDGLPDKKP